MSWNVLAEVYKSGHIKNYKNKLKFNAEFRGKQIVSGICSEEFLHKGQNYFIGRS